jgi:transposase
MIPLPSGVRVWIAAGHSDMRRGMQGLARQVQEVLQRDPHLCVGCKYVAARSLARNFGGDERPLPPRNIQI